MRFFILFLFFHVYFVAFGYAQDAERNDPIKTKFARVGVIPFIGGFHINQAGNDAGYLSSLIKGIMATLNWKYSLRTIHPIETQDSKKIAMINDAELDMIFGVLPTRMIKDNLLMSNKIYAYGLYYVSTQEEISDKKWPDDFRGTTYGCIIWQVGCKHMQKVIKGQAQYYNNAEEMMQGLELGFENSVIIASYLAKYYEKKMDGTVLLLNSKAKGNIPMVIAFHKDNNKLRDVINGALEDFESRAWAVKEKEFWFEELPWVNNPQYDRVEEKAFTYERQYRKTAK